MGGVNSVLERIVQVVRIVPTDIRYRVKGVFANIDPDFANRTEARGGGFILGAANYGQGSSRENAALAPRYLGIRAVMAIT